MQKNICTFSQQIRIFIFITFTHRRQKILPRDACATRSLWIIALNVLRTLHNGTHELSTGGHLQSYRRRFDYNISEFFTHACELLAVNCCGLFFSEFIADLQIETFGFGPRPEIIPLSAVTFRIDRLLCSPAHSWYGTEK